VAQETISVDALFDGERFRQYQTIYLDEGRITAIDNTPSVLPTMPGMLVPGYIDTQVNGGGGKLFNHSPDVETLKVISRAHQHFGTTGWLPTLVTDSLEKMQQAADAVALARNDPSLGILGIHFEGPHLSVEKKGVHSESFIRNLSEAEKSIFARKDLGKVVVTLAPEMVSTDEIKSLVDLGVIVSLGHSNATVEQTNQALNAGAAGFTHLFNAMSPFTSRKPGMVGAALLDNDSFAGLILDGVHVHPESAKLAVKSKTNMMLVTDAMPPVGSDEDKFEFFGETIVKRGSQLVNNEGRLAGSLLDMGSAVKNAVELLDLELSTAINLASKNPARFLGLGAIYGSLKIGYKANMVLLNERQQVTKVWINGIKLD